MFFFLLFEWAGYCDSFLLDKDHTDGNTWKSLQCGMDKSKGGDIGATLSMVKMVISCWWCQQYILNTENKINIESQSWSLGLFIYIHTIRK